MTWTRETIMGELLPLFKQHSQTDAAVSDSSRIIADLGLDSLGVMEAIADIEDRFRLQIPDDALQAMETIADVAQAIEARIEAP